MSEVIKTPGFKEDNTPWIEPEDTTNMHPFWCDECGAKAPFTIPGWPIEHESWCSFKDEDPEERWEKAKEYCLRTGKTIP